MEKPKEQKLSIPIDPTLPFCVICDLDGTLALFGDKSPYDRNYAEDDINGAVGFLLRELPKYITVIFVTGRKEKYREVTQKWIFTQSIVNKLQFSYKLLMRKTDDTRKDFVVKKELYDTEIKGKFNVIFVLDDRNQVVKMWREIGLTCFQVADGDF